MLTNSTIIGMPKISLGQWEAFKVFLVVKERYTNTHKNLQGTYSRFKILSQFFENLEFSDKNVETFLWSIREANYSTSYYNNFIKVLRKYAKYLSQTNPDFVNFMGDFSYLPEVKNKMYDIFTPEEIKKICEVDIPYRYFPEKTNQKYQTLFWFLALTGCRINEALTLTKADLHESFITFRITKTKQIRNVPISKFLSDKLFKLTKDLTDDQLVFSSSDKILDDSTINIDLKKRCLAVGIKKRAFCHLFRHSLANELLKQGQPITIIAQILGHAKIETTNAYYIHLQQEQLMDCLYAHPLLKEELNLEMVKKRINEMIDRVVDKTRFNIHTSDSENDFSVSITNR